MKKIQITLTGTTPLIMCNSLHFCTNSLFKSHPDSFAGNSVEQKILTYKSLLNIK